MAICKKCGGRKRRWPRSCPQCRTKIDREEVATTGADMAVAGGAFEWIGRAITAAVRAVLRAFN